MYVYCVLSWRRTVPCADDRSADPARRNLYGPRPARPWVGSWRPDRCRVPFRPRSRLTQVRIRGRTRTAKHLPAFKSRLLAVRARRASRSPTSARRRVADQPCVTASRVCLLCTKLAMNGSYLTSWLGPCADDRSTDPARRAVDGPRPARQRTDSWRPDRCRVPFRPRSCCRRCGYAAERGRRTARLALASRPVAVSQAAHVVFAYLGSSLPPYEATMVPVSTGGCCVADQSCDSSRLCLLCTALAITVRGRPPGSGSCADDPISRSGPATSTASPGRRRVGSSRPDRLRRVPRSGLAEIRHAAGWVWGRTRTASFLSGVGIAAGRGQPGGGRHVRRFRPVAAAGRGNGRVDNAGPGVRWWVPLRGSVICDRSHLCLLCTGSVVNGSWSDFWFGTMRR